ncbi:MAG: hypothetical protein CMF96_12670 [Candidatus Marinimicrobia bacterium]|nr:hypothetical protein [Candidatus Neomarinimicrobiota bacterium]|tara:strand:- start:342 stop:599 length:258 start_codon:yes stop_codon:yes gene_type:complete
MNKNKIFEEFESLSMKLGYKVIHGKGSFTGDSCLINEDKYIVLNKNKPVEQKLKLFAQIFAKLDLTNVYVKPALRELVNQEKINF